MLKDNLKKVSVIIIILALLVFAVKTSFATNDEGGIFEQISNLNKENSGGTIQTGTRNNNPDSNNPNNTNNNNINNTNNNTNSPTTTPHTGVNNSSTIIFIVLFAASSVYAYKKIRDYDA